MPFNPALPNAYDQGLIPFELREEYYKEYIGLTPLSNFMGSAPDSGIQILEIANGGGDSVRVPFRREINYRAVITGYDQAEGNEQTPVFYYDRISILPRRIPVGLEGVDFVEVITPIKVFDSMRELLLNASRKNLVMSIFDCACALPVKGGIYTPATNIPGYDRAVFAGLAPVRGAWYANINAGVAAMNGGITPATNGLSVAMIRKLKSYAVAGGAGDIFEAEAKIMPMQVAKKNAFPEEFYVLLIDPASYISLASDTAWSNYAYRGTIENSDQPTFIRGARYRGMIEGVMIYECPELAQYRVVSGGSTSAWNLFMGAQAFGLAWAERPWFRTTERDFGFNKAIAICEIRGQKLLQFPSFQNQANNVERGIIHAFSRIA